MTKISDAKYRLCTKRCFCCHRIGHASKEKRKKLDVHGAIMKGNIVIYQVHDNSHGFPQQCSWSFSFCLRLMMHVPLNQRVMIRRLGTRSVKNKKLLLLQMHRKAIAQNTVLAVLMGSRKSMQARIIHFLVWVTHLVAKLKKSALI